MNSLEKDNSYYSLKNWSILQAEGPDVEQFLSGQLTNEILEIRTLHGQLNSRISRTGELNFYTYVLKLSSEHFLLLAPKSKILSLKEDLEKFIIMEDVTITEFEQDYSVTFGLNSIITSDLKFIFLGQPAGIALKASPAALSEEVLRKLSFFFGLPNESNDKQMMVTETALVDTSVSMTKGCFVGQETVKKIETNRGAGKKELLIEVPASEDLSLENLEYKVLDSFNHEGKKYIKVHSKREIRVEGKKVPLSANTEGIVRLLPLFNLSEKACAENLFEAGVGLFSEDKEPEAKELLELALLFDPKNADILEALGALEGRLENYNRAIDLMNKLEEVDPSSVMACTNRSLYYMKLGQIEKAEDEKSKATVMSFQVASKNSKEKREEKRKELETRMSMFKQVLEIDEMDEMANEGLAKSYFDLENYEDSLVYVEKLLGVNEKNHKVLALKMKICAARGQMDEAKGLAEVVLSLAGKKGDFILANEAQSLISSLEKTV